MVHTHYLYNIFLLLFYKEIHDIFLTHEHTDHLLGMIWMIRVIGQAIQKGKYEGNCTIYCHDGLVNVLRQFVS